MCFGHDNKVRRICAMYVFLCIFLANVFLLFAAYTQMYLFANARNERKFTIYSKAKQKQNIHIKYAYKCINVCALQIK